MAFVDYYKILGVSKDIPQKDVKKAYLKRAKQFHPDLHQDDPKAKAKFQALTEAYEVIGDPEKRAKYDQYGENWKQAEAFGGDNPFGGANPFGNGNPLAAETHLAVSVEERKVQTLVPFLMNSSEAVEVLEVSNNPRRPNRR